MSDTSSSSSLAWLDIIYLSCSIFITYLYSIHLYSTLLTQYFVPWPIVCMHEEFLCELGLFRRSPRWRVSIWCGSTDGSVSPLTLWPVPTQHADGRVWPGSSTTLQKMFERLWEISRMRQRLERCWKDYLPWDEDPKDEARVLLIWRRHRTGDILISGILTCILVSRCTSHFQSVFWYSRHSPFHLTWLLESGISDFHIYHVLCDRGLNSSFKFYPASNI
jgi:hypothetical protein